MAKEDHFDFDNVLIVDPLDYGMPQDPWMLMDEKGFVATNIDLGRVLVRDPLDIGIPDDFLVGKVEGSLQEMVENGALKEILGAEGMIDGIPDIDGVHWTDWDPAVFEQFADMIGM
jgi:hypothetical protein